MNPAIDYDKLAEALTSRLKLVAADEIWSGKDCAEYFKCSPQHFTDRISKRSTFPKSIAGSKFRWFAQEVIAWAKKR